MGEGLTQATRGQQVRRLYAALREAGYLSAEDEIARFEARFRDAMGRHGFYAVVWTDAELNLLPESVSADTELLGGDFAATR